MIDKQTPALRQYMREIDHPLLTLEEEIELSKRKDAGCKLAYQSLVQANLRLVVKIAYEFSYSGVEFMDLISEGNLGLMEGLNRYDYTKGRVVNYIPFWIRKHIKTAMNNKYRQIKIPNNTFQKISYLSGIIRTMENENGRRPTWEEIADVTGTSEESIQHIMEVSLPLKSMHELVGPEGGTELGLLLVDENAVMPYEGAITSDSIDYVAKAMEFLEVREREIIEYTYGLAGKERRTVRWLSEEYAVSRQRIAQIQEECLVKLAKIIRKIERTNSVNR